MDKDELKQALKEIADEEKKTDDGAEVAKPAVSVDVEKIAEKIGKSISDAILQTGVTQDKKMLEQLFTPKGGLQGFKFPSVDKLSELSHDQKIVTWFKALVQKDKSMEAMSVFKALVEGTDDQGGYLVPEEFSNEIYRILPSYAVMRRIARLLPMNTDTLNLNTLAARPYAYWTAEYASKATTSAEFGRVVLSPHDLVCLLPVTDQLVADANINVVQFITELFTEAIAAAEDDAFFTGNGSGKPQGIASCSGIRTYDVGGVLNFDDIISIIYTVGQRVRLSPTSAFVASGKVIEILKKVKDGNNRYIWTPGATSDVTTPVRETLYGYPIYEQNALSEDQLYFGDWKYYVIGDRQQIVVETTREGGDAWRRNAMEIKAVERVDGKCVVAKAFVKATGVQS